MRTAILEDSPTRTTRYPVRRGINFLDLIPIVILIGLIALIFIQKPNLMNARFIEIKANAAFTLILVTVGQTLVLLIGGIDLSVGGVISLANCLAATQMTDDPASIIFWCVAIILIGVFAGFINGFIIAVMRVTPFIATLATWSIFNGAALLILETPGGRVSRPFRQLIRSDPLGIPNTIVFIVVIILAWLWFKRTRWGTQLYAVGSHENHAFFSGVSIVRTKMAIYIASSVFAALAGLYRTVEVGTGSPIAGDPFILQSVAAALVGGISLAGGRGNLILSIAGAFVMLFINDLIQFSGVSSFYTPMVQGIFLITAVLLNATGYRIRLRRALEQ